MKNWRNRFRRLDVSDVQVHRYRSFLRSYITLAYTEVGLVLQCYETVVCSLQLRVYSHQCRVYEPCGWPRSFIAAVSSPYPVSEYFFLVFQYLK